MYEGGKTIQTAREMNYRIGVLGLSKVTTDRTAETIIKRAATVLTTHRGRSSPHGRSSPDAGTVTQQALID
jgi:hypothetical protein